MEHRAAGGVSPTGPYSIWKKRKRIDRSMIGEPMNFVHLTHVGSGDMTSQGYSMPGSVQERMKSKSGLVINSTTDTRQTVGKTQISSQ
ncbi:CDC42 small effector protein 2-B-like isoform X2 [Heterodontus francisci]|uniref:CDC42 small effector protein 2-B-like isoform X2 n=1 Tax=Heterodontus francisci TaxID=7792 RepID=UPI00355B4CFD